MTAPHVLLCDDDLELCRLLVEYLTLNGCVVTAVHSAEDAVAALAARDASFDALVLDVMLPGQDGLTALRAIRPQHALPILMLSGRGEPIDRVVGLELGADDYLSKPCLPRELLARLQALLRRAREPVGATAPELRFGALQLRPSERRAWAAGRELSLTGAEFSVLLALGQHAGRIVSRQALTEKGLNRALERFDRAVDVHVSRLRRKLRDAAGAALEIESVRGAGYILRGVDSSGGVA
jgi:two-component system, OmpR family, response regulator CpxR